MKLFKEIFLIMGIALVLGVGVAFKSIVNQKTLQDIQQRQGDTGFAVVELFTSEGCSSCPPADELIEKLQKGSDNKQLYIMAFHVDYWDHQGWKDPFSKHEYSLRQRQYGDWFKLRTIYTPQMVVNGATELVGSDEGAVLNAIHSALESTATSPLILKADIEKEKIVVNYTGAGNNKNEELSIALVQKTAASEVKAGENAGRSLSHVQVVREMVHHKLGDQRNLVLTLPEDFYLENWELIGFVQNKVTGKITQAARFEFENNI